MLLPVIAFFALQNSAITRPSRAEFADRFLGVHIGLSKSGVRAILGAPDDVWTVKDPYPYTSFAFETWAWGTSGHLSFPTLGRVTFSPSGQVDGWCAPLHDGKMRSRYSNDSKANPTDPIDPKDPELRIGDRNHMFEVHWDEAELRALLNAIDRNMYPEGRFSQAKPGLLELIRLANVLIPLGEAKATAALCEYASLGSNEPFLNDLVRCLYVPKTPSGFLPTPLIGRISPERPANKSELPVFPVVMQDGIPFELMIGTIVGGAGPCLPCDLDEVRKEGVFRTSLITPSDTPLQSVDGAMAVLNRSGLFSTTPSGFTIPTPEVRTIRQYLMREVRQLIRTVVDPNSDAKDIQMSWDQGKQMYVLPDGTHLPLAPIAPIHPRIVFPLPEFGPPSATLSFERKQPGHVTVELEWVPTGTVHPLTFEVIVGHKTNKRLVSIALPSAEGMEDVAAVGYDHKFLGPDLMYYSFQRLFPKGPTEISLKIKLKGKTITRSFTLAAEPPGMKYVAD